MFFLPCTKLFRWKVNFPIRWEIGQNDFKVCSSPWDFLKLPSNYISKIDDRAWHSTNHIFFRVKVVSYRNHCSVKAAFPIRIQTELIVSWLHLHGDASCYVVKCLDTLTCLLTASDARGLSQDFMLRNKSGNAWNDSWLPGLCTGLCPCPDFCFPVPLLNILKVTLEYVGASQNPGAEI